MKIAKMFEKGTVYSFEVFPPKKTSPVDTILKTLNGLKDLNPDFISVTYGAGGSIANNETCRIADLIKNKYGIEAVAHLTCAELSKADVNIVLSDLEKIGIKNVLALRGDKIPEDKSQQSFVYASDLVSYIIEKTKNSPNGSFDICGACYPEVHFEAEDAVEDIHNLKKKVDAGASYLISQLFFDNSKYYDFIERARIGGINVPIAAGIMPVVKKSQIERIVSMCGASLPPKFVKTMQRFEDNPDALRDAGIAYAVDQIVDLVSNGVDGIHLYTMNNPYVARKITESVESIVRSK
ncbi:MAG TPA: methylenetetrahydrofolate reductase [NAD(P)H] [Treponemataceae bacterium]|nr:methylenetetrahydrofolate reductase [NAD(P)H] [Treponemataceae bacterium]